MASVPRILRAVPHGAITRPEHGIPVIARIRWANGADHDVPAIAVAWTREAVEIEWEAPGTGLRSDWVAARDCRRAGSPELPPDDTPRVRAGKRPRW
jgi:hypothetical protein